MRQLASIAWKEWHELRIFLWIAIGVFIGLPVAGGLEELADAPMHHFQILTAPWVIGLGGVLAVFIAIGASCRDFSGHLEDFWRSRPVGIVRWLLVKYAIGLLVVLAGCLLPLFLEQWINGARDSDITVFLLFPFQWIAIYSLSFLAGCLVRRTAHAAMLGLAAMLLVYFLPLVLPPLSWINFAETSNAIFPFARENLMTILRHTPLAKFAGGMLAVAIASFLAAIVAVRGNWHVDSGRKMMYGSVSAALLILFSSAGFQLGTSLPVLAHVDLPNEGQVLDFQFDSQRGTIVFSKPDLTNGQQGVFTYNLHTIDITPTGLQIGPAEPTGAGWATYYGRRTRENPDIVYQYSAGDATDHHFRLSVFERGNLLRTMDLPLEYDPDANSRPWPRLYAWTNRLYVYNDHLVTLDIANPRMPRIISNTNTPFIERRGDYPSLGPDSCTMYLPQFPDLPPVERVRAILGWWGERGFDGEILCSNSANDDELYEYRLTEITDTRATFKKIGEYKSSMLEQLFGRHGFEDLTLQNGLLYVHQGFDRGPFESVISIFDTAGPRPLRPIGHFAARGIEMARPLPDGRALVVGEGKIWLVGTPRR